MKITVKFFAFKELAGTSESTLELPAGATVADLTVLLAARFPGLFPRAEQAVYLVEQRIGGRDTQLSDGAVVVMLQMVAGG